MEEDFDIRQERMAKGEKDFENALRPLRFGDFSGQQKVVDNLEVFVEAAKYRGEPLDHTLLHGPPGLGKTTLSNIIARTWRRIQDNKWTCTRQTRRPCRHSYLARASRCTIHRRNSPIIPTRGRVSLFGYGGLSHRHND